MGLLRDTISNFCVFVHMNPVSTHEFRVELEEKLREYMDSVECGENNICLFR